MDGNALPQLFFVRKCNFRISYAHSYIGYLLDLYCQSGMSNARMHEGLHFIVLYRVTNLEFWRQARGLGGADIEAMFDDVQNEKGAQINLLKSLVCKN